MLRLISITALHVISFMPHNEWKSMQHNANLYASCINAQTHLCVRVCVLVGANPSQKCLYAYACVYTCVISKFSLLNNRYCHAF